MFLSHRNSLENKTKENNSLHLKNDNSEMRSTFSNDFKYIEWVIKSDEELQIENL